MLPTLDKENKILNSEFIFNSYLNLIIFYHLISINLISSIHTENLSTNFNSVCKQKSRMDKWKKSVAVVTGGNSGIGLAILKSLAQHGLKVVCFDIQLDSIEKLKVELKNAKIYSWHCDVTKDDSTEAAFKWVEKNIGSVDILINCAGHRKTIELFDQQKSMADIVSNIDVNYTAVIRCTRLALKSMENRDAYGYVININSISSTVQNASNLMRSELHKIKNRKIRITSVTAGDADNSSSVNPSINAEHIGDAVIYVLKTPHDVTVTDLRIKMT